MLKDSLALGTEETEFLEEIYKKMNLTARSYHRLLKVSQTIADLDGAENVQMKHLREALFYRGMDTLFLGGNADDKE